MNLESFALKFSEFSWGTVLRKCKAC